MTLSLIPVTHEGQALERALLDKGHDIRDLAVAACITKFAASKMLTYDRLREKPWARLRPALISLGIDPRVIRPSDPGPEPAEDGPTEEPASPRADRVSIDEALHMWLMELVNKYGYTRLGTFLGMARENVYKIAQGTDGRRVTINQVQTYLDHQQIRLSEWLAEISIAVAREEGIRGHKARKPDDDHSGDAEPA